MQKFSKVTIGEVSRTIKIQQKYYLPWDIDEMIPTLEFHVRELLDLKKKIRSLNDVVQKCAGDEADPIVHSMKKKLSHTCGEYMSVMEKLAEMGAIVDNVDAMAFDFYSWHEGEEIFLCWQSGETRVGNYHYPEESFVDRRILEMTDVLTIEDSREMFLN